MRKILSFLVLLMLFATGSYAVPLTRDLWQGGGNCAYNLNVSTEEIYGLGTPDNTKYADLSGYSKLILTVSSGQPRLFFNTKTYNGDRLTVGPNAGPYMTVNGNTYTVDLNAIWFDEGKAYLNSIKGSGYGTPATITSMELVPYEGTPVKWNFDNKIEINGTNVKDNFNTDDPIVIPVRNNNGSAWTVAPRLKVRNADTEAVLQVADLCGNTNALGNYFKVIYSENGILHNTAFGTSTTSGGEVYPQIQGLTADKYGDVSMTVIYKGNGTYKPFSKTYNFTVEGLPLQFVEYNPSWGQSYEKFLDESQYRLFFKLQSSGNDVNYNTSIPCTVTAVDDSGDPIEAKIMKLDQSRYFDATRLDIYLTPNTLGTQTFKIEYPGDDIYAPTTYFFDVKVKQHMVELRWVDSNDNETDEWRTNLGNQYGGIPKLKMFVDNQEVNVADNMSRLQFTSSNTSVASINNNISNAGNDNENNRHYVDFHGAGITVVDARFLNSYKTVDGLNYYYFNDESRSYTMILEYGNTSDEKPRIVWITGSRYEWVYYSQNAAGSFLGQKWIPDHVGHPNWVATDNSQLSDPNKYPFVDNFGHYGNNFFVSATALKASITDEDLARIHIFPIPGYKNHYYVRDDADNQWWVNAPTYGGGTWRLFSDVPDSYLFKPANFDQDYPGDNFKYQNFIKYMVDKPAMIRESKVIKGTGSNFNEGGNRAPQNVYKFTPAYASQDSLKVYAYIEGYNVFSTTKVLVAPGELQLRFVPDQNTVNEGKSIMPYVNCPDLRMEDVKKIWLTYDCPNTLKVENDGVVYEAGVTSNADIAKYLYTVTANDTIWKNADAKNYNDDGTPIIANIQEVRPTTWLRGINPEIKGLAAGSCTVTLHLESDMYMTATADYDLTVLPVGDQPMFHWEMNDKIENGKHVDDGVMKTIKISQGDFVYMPGIVGNANGNTQYSQPNQYKYMYGIQNGVVIMNYKKYFPGEGIPNYYVSYTPNGNPSVPVSNTTTNQPAIVTWAIGLGDYWRNDSLMIYGNEPGVMYLCAQDAQTGQTCTPIKIEVLKSVGDEGDLLDQKHDELDGMSYPFTWDFEHIDMTEYIKDASNTTEGNGGTYWRKAWDENYPKGEEPIGKAYNRDYRHETDYYQYNGGFNADWDDKDGNKKSRQRWFKDIHVNGKYAPEFKGMMLNLAGLEYWEQKYQRFLIHEDGDYIRFQGGPIFVQLPGFGLLAKKGGIEDGTRAHDNYIGSTHNHINTAKYNVNEGYTKLLSVDNNHNVNIQYPVQTTNASGQARDYRNNKVRFVIKARGGRTVMSDNEIPNANSSSQFHIGGASMLYQDLDVNDIKWKQGVHNGYSYYNLNRDETKVYIVELDPYDPELQDHIYLMFNNDVDVYWMAITNEPRNILSDFDGVTYAYPKDIDMDKTNQTLAQQTKEGIYTKADENGNYALASVGEHTIKNVYQVGSDTPGEGTQLQLKAYKVSSFDPTNQSVSLTEIEGNIPQNEGVMLYTEPRMSALTANGGHIPGLTAEHYDRGATAYSEWVTKSKIVNGKTVYYDEEVFHVAPDSTFQGNMYNNSHNYYTFPLYFIAMAENMSEENYNRIRPTSTGSAVDPSIGSGHVVTDNLLRPVTYGQVLPMDYTYQDTKLINFGYNNEFICRKLVYQEIGEDKYVQTKEMSDPYVSGSGSNTHEGMYYYRIGIDNAKFYRINTSSLNHHNRSAYLTLTWDEYKVNTVGKPINMGGSKSTDSSTGSPTAEGPNDPYPPKSPIRFSPSYNPVDIVFGVNEEEQFVSEDGGFPDGINEVEQNPTGDGKVYNLNGVPVNTLSKGVYIINGKKIVVK